MTRFCTRFLAAFGIQLMLVARLAVAGEVATGDCSLGDEVLLDAHDLREITLQVLDSNPLLSSSPGVKFASALCSVRSVELADVIFYPHADHAGIREAFQVQCRRQGSGQSWTCDDVSIRRYLQLESQAFEVRVTAGIGSDEALALIRATREFLRANAAGGPDIPQTAVMIHPYRDGYLVSWGSPEGHIQMTAQARLSEDGDPADSQAWRASIYLPEDRPLE